MVKTNTSVSPYLMSNSSFKNITIKFKLRNGVSNLGEDLFRQNRDNIMCKFCGAFESLQHFIFHCDAYSECRTKMYRDLSIQCDDYQFCTFLQDQTFALYQLLGDHDDIFNKCFLDFLGSAWNIRDNDA